MKIIMGVVMLYTSGMVVRSRDAVSSVIYLVGTIVSGGIIMMILGIEYIPLIYVIVYVGGISILFLFVIMMVDLQGGKGEKREVMKGVVIITAIMKG